MSLFGVLTMLHGNFCMYHFHQMCKPGLWNRERLPLVLGFNAVRRKGKQLLAFTIILIFIHSFEVYENPKTMGK